MLDWLGVWNVACLRAAPQRRGVALRIAIAVEYDGSVFSGWQSQHGARTVQDCVEQALSRVADHPVRVVCAGRTDAGVHACAQVIHFDTDARRRERAWVRGGNTHLPPEVALRWAREVPDTFHARFCARRRAYRYLLTSDPVRPTYLRGRVSWDYRRLDPVRMQQAAALLLGRHDFSAFRAAGCQARSPVRDLVRLDVTGDGTWFRFDAEADAFLQHMVRNLVGVLCAIGAGEREPGWAAEVLAGRDRRLGGVTAPPDGLYLARIDYPEAFGLPSTGCRDRIW